MLSWVNPVGKFYDFMQGFWSCIPLPIRLVIILSVGLVLLFAIVKSLRGA